MVALLSCDKTCFGHYNKYSVYLISPGINFVALLVTSEKVKKNSRVNGTECIGLFCSCPFKSKVRQIVFYKHQSH